MSWLEGTRARLRLLFARRADDARTETEIHFHIEMETERLMRDEGLDAGEARRRALIAFGGVQKHKETLRDGRTFASLGGMSLDFKLGFRMLVKYPGLTIVGGLAMAFAIWIGTVTFELVTLFLHPTLPLPGGDRIVLIRNWDVVTSDAEPHALHDFLIWRETLTSVTDLGAYQDASRNLIAGDGDARPLQVAEITASAFRIAPTPPLLGRTIETADERAGAPPVVVLGYDVWQTRFAGDRNVVGRSVQIDDTHATVVGVMPEGFAFPVSHEAWMALQPDALPHASRDGPGISIFGRLAPGVSLEKAQAELTTLGLRAAAERPETHKYLQPQVGSYAKLFSDASGAEFGVFLAIPVFAIMLLILICGNVALLLFARAATRETELVVRSALGASRGRIIAQLFAEALVLGGVAAVVGLVGARLALDRWGLKYLEVGAGPLPFWYDPHLSPMTVLYAAGLTVLAAVVAGVMPALKITRGFETRLRQGSAGGGGLRFSGVWTAVIITQVAATVAFPGVALVEQRELVRIRSFDAGFKADEYLAVHLDIEVPNVSGPNGDAAQAAQRARFQTALAALRQRVMAEPGVGGVTFVDRLPRLNHSERRIELDESATDAKPTASASTWGDGLFSGRQTRDFAANPLREVSMAFIDPNYFDVLQSPIRAGRAFHSGDLAPDARAVIVDQGFVDQVLQGRNPIGRRVRFAAPPSRDARSADETRPWYEIVGVVKELGMGAATTQGRAAGLYMPTVPGSSASVNMVIHVRRDPMSLGPRVRAIAAAVDPTLRLSEFQRLDEVSTGVLWFVGLWLRMTILLTAIALVLSLAGIYAVLSFIVARRTREIGVRVALGASRRRVVAAIFRRPLTQVSLGVLAGGVLVGAGAFALSGGGLSLVQVALLIAYAGLMFGVCLLACVVPTRRALRVEPTEALRAE